MGAVLFARVSDRSNETIQRALAFPRWRDYRLRMDDLKRVQQDLRSARNAASSGDTSGAEMYILSASRIVDQLLQQSKTPAAVALGAKGGSVTAKRGSEYFRELAARRKTNAGGRPRKVAE